MQQIDVGQIEAVRLHPVQQKPIPKQRNIKGTAVEGAQHVTALQGFLYLSQHIPLLRVIPHNVLIYHEAIPSKPSQPHQKGYRARSACKPCSFCIQIEDTGGVKAERKGRR